MADASETERLKARVAELEAKQAARSSVGGVLSIVQAVIGLVPRWLVIAAGLVILAWLGLELYQKAQQVILQTDTMRSQKDQAVAEACAAKATVKPLDPSRWAEWEQKERKRRPECFTN